MSYNMEEDVSLEVLRSVTFLVCIAFAGWVLADPVGANSGMAGLFATIIGGLILLVVNQYE